MDELDFYTKAEIDEKFNISAGEDNGLDFYTKAEIREKVGTPETIVIDENNMLLDFYTKTEIDSIQTDPMADYTQIEWIQSTGTQWINTGYVQQGNYLRIDANVNIIYAGYDTMLVMGNGQGLGIRGSYIFCIYINYGAALTGINHTFNEGFVAVTAVIDVNNRTTALVENGNRNTTSYTAINTGGSPYGIFGRSDGSQRLSAQLKSCKIYDNNGVVRDFVPVIRNADGKPGLWDKVGEQFYTNAGTGEFVIPT